MAPLRTCHRVDLDGIRANSWSVGGYANVFNVPMPGTPRSLVRSGAFNASIIEGGWVLIENHQRLRSGETFDVLASMSTATLFAEEDFYGLWFEAQLSGARGRRLAQLADRDLLMGVSYGSSDGVQAMNDRTGVRVESVVNVWEISLLTAPYRPACAATWCLPNAAARSRRGRIVADAVLRRLY